MPRHSRDDTCPLCPRVEAGPRTGRTRWAKSNMFRERSNDCYDERSALRRELVSPPILSAFMDGAKEKPFRARTEISLSRVMRMTRFIQLFLLAARLPKEQVVNLSLPASSCEPDIRNREESTSLQS